ncbi:hypothetical protein BASA62_003698 [Batrachochytrium salamandrivorans]|nr:hypothetical protein BASA62_003698 [Batrachochytrium salamandrivorans]
MGYARTEPSQLDITELREKAREDHWPSKKFKVELEKLRGKPKPYVWVMTRESSGEEYGEAFKNVGSVKFWDVTQGYEPTTPPLVVDSPQAATTVGGERGGRNGAGSRKDAKGLVSPMAGGASTAAQNKPDTSLLALQSSGWAARFKQILSERQANCDELLRESLPFTEIICIFNHKNLWVNAQRYLNPADITYDLGADSPGWIAVLTKDASEHVVPFYPPKTLGPKLTEDKSSELRTAVEDELESGLTNFRSSKSIGTRLLAGR